MNKYVYFKSRCIKTSELIEQIIKQNPFLHDFCVKLFDYQTKKLLKGDEVLKNGTTVVVKRYPKL